MDLQQMFIDIPIIGRFAIIFGIIVVLPKLTERFGIPGVVGLIAGGILLGPSLLGILSPNGAVISLFSELGKLFLMFFAGFEINLEQFKRVGSRAVGFGALTFAFPLATGVGVGLFLGYGLNGSLIIGSLMASHTLLAMPLVKRLGLLSSNAVVITVGATIFTDITSMLVLAICLSIHLNGFSLSQLMITLLGLAVYVPLVIFGLSWLAKKLFARFSSSEVRFSILVLIITIASVLAELIHLEGIVGAFLTGIAVNRAVGEHNGEGHILSVVSQSLFIPVFFLATGFLVDIPKFIDTILHDYTIVLMLVGGLILSKLIAARLMGRFYGLTKPESLFAFSLTIPQVAATLAAAIVSYNTFDATGTRLIQEPMLNAVVVLILVTSMLGPVLTKLYGSKIAS